MFSVRIGGLSEPLQSFKVQRLGALYPVRTAKVQTGGTLKLAYQASSSLTASAPDAHVRGTSSTLTCSSTVTPSGGLGPYTYSWALAFYDASLPPTIGNPAFATSGFTQSGMSLGDFNTATFVCTVTDSLGSTATASVDATFYYYDSSGGLHP